MKNLYSILIAAIFTVLMLSTEGSVYAQEEQDATTIPEPTFLAIQRSESGSISPVIYVLYVSQL